MDHLDLLLPPTPPPDAKKSKYNPFILALRLDNLPPATRPGHLTHVLGHPPTNYGQSKRREETGVSLIQVYTVPKQSKAKTATGLGRMLFGGRAVGHGDDKVHTAASSPRHSDDLADQARPLLSRSIDSSPAFDFGGHGPRTTVNEVSISRGASREAEEVAASDPGDGSEDKTYAIIHFRDEYWLYRAKHIFRRVTIDGRHIETTTKRWNGSAVRRLWTKSVGQTE